MIEEMVFEAQLRLFLYAMLCAFWALAGFFSASIYRRKGRSAVSGFVLGVLLGPIGVIIAAIIPATTQGRENELLNTGKYKRCPYCQEVINAKAIVCPRCQRDQPEAALRSNPALASESSPDWIGKVEDRQPPMQSLPPAQPDTGSSAGLFVLLGAVVVLLLGLFGYLLSQRLRPTATAPTPTLYVIPTAVAQLAAVESPSPFLTYTPWITYTPSITPTTAPTKTLVPTHTPRPTSTLRPTFTPRPPSTAKPAATRLPSGVSVTVTEYVEGVGLIVNQIDAGFDLLQILIDELNANSSVIDNASWLSDVQAVVDTQADADIYMQLLDPPADLQSVHAKYLQASSKCHEAALTFQQAVVLEDQALADEYAEDIDSCEALLNGAINALNAYLREID